MENVSPSGRPFKKTLWLRSLGIAEEYGVVESEWKIELRVHAIELYTTLFVREYCGDSSYS